MTVQQAVDSFLKWKDTHMENSETYRVALRPLLQRCKEWDTKDLTIETVTDIVSHMEGSTFMFMTVLKVFSRYCHYSRIPTVSPHLIKVRRHIDPTTRQSLARKEIDELVAFLDEDTFLGIRNRLLIKMLSDTGCRLSEILDLTVSMMDAQRNSVMIVTKKAKTNRYIMWSDDTHRLLQTYLGMRVSKDWRTDRLFIGRRGTILTNRGAQHMFSKLSEEVLGEKHHLHEMRHFKAHQIIEKGGDIYAVKMVLGHSSLESALTYLRLQAQESLAVVKRYI